MQPEPRGLAAGECGAVASQTGASRSRSAICSKRSPWKGPLGAPTRKFFFCRDPARGRRESRPSVAAARSRPTGPCMPLRRGVTRSLLLPALRAQAGARVREWVHKGKVRLAILLVPPRDLIAGLQRIDGVAILETTCSSGSHRVATRSAASRPSIGAHLDRLIL